MPLTITEKILARAAGKRKVEPGEIVSCKVDLALANDITGPPAFKAFQEIGLDKVWNSAKVALVPDHFTPNKDIKSAEQAKAMKAFARKQGAKWYFEIGRMGIEHALLPQEGLTLPGQVIVGADSHTCTYGAVGAFATGIGSTELAGVYASGELWFKVPETMLFEFNGALKEWVSGKDIILKIIGDIGVDGALYRAMEFAGDAIVNLSMDSRFTMCNMAIEAGGKNGIIAPDAATKAYIRKALKRRGEKPEFKYFKSDAGAPYADKIQIDASKIEPLVACPHLPSNVKPARELSSVAVDQVLIGSCTNGRLEDLETADKILKGKKVNENVRVIIVPATQEIYLEAMKKGFIKDFIQAGCAVSTPTCGACLGGHMGVLAEGEKCISTTNRNFVGRMGSPKSEVYLASPATSAASALTGVITDPRDLKA
jgi:3-isopropylmalate/(R)-2-methylmalate dehydratase large subunit